ncbi:hypothetical protein HDE_06207 [Halotydeus destructor]|nr:hypothetical protein HDE_06207 [Halotydeus destructor]
MASTQLHDLFRIALRLIDAGKEGQLTEEEENRLKLAVIEASRGDIMCKSGVEETLLRYLASHLFPGIESLIEKSSLLGLDRARRYNSTVCGLMTLFCYQIQEGVSGIHREFTKPHVDSDFLRQTFISADHGCRVASEMMTLVLPGSPYVPESLFFTPGPGLCNVKRWLALSFPQLELEKSDFILLNDLILFDTYDPHMWGSKVWPLLHFLATLGTVKRAKMSCASAWEELCASEAGESEFGSDSVDLQHWLWEMHNKVGAGIGKKPLEWKTFEEQDIPQYTEIAQIIDEF